MKIVRILATAATALALALLLSLRFVGGYSHQALAAALFLGVCWILPSRAFLGWRGELDWRFVTHARDPEVRAELFQAVGRGSFWVVLTGAIALIWPRSVELDPILWGVLGMGAVRVAAELLPTKQPNPGTTVAMLFAGLVIAVDLVRVVLPGAPAVVVLQPPFQGEWTVIQGGHSPLVSHHLSAYNQIYALDLLPIEDGRIFVEDADPGDPLAMWRCLHEPYFAPVAGTVVATRSDMPDAAGVSLVAELDAAVGNHVILETADGYFVVLAHLEEGSVAVEVGQRVEPGDLLGRCGNSGNTTNPHLHLQVQTHKDLWDPDNRSVPFAFEAGGRALSRNARVRGLPR